MRVILCALAVAAFVGPGTASAANKPPANLTDSQIQASIRAKLSRGKLAADHFTVTVQDRVAILEGKTAVVQHKGTATRIAKSSGAVAVRNRIQISEEARARAVARLRRSEGALPGSSGRTTAGRVTQKTAVSGGPPPQPEALARATVIPTEQ